MRKWKEGDRVRVVERRVTEDDRKKSRYYEHMAGLIGSVQSVYSDTEVAVKVEPESMGDVAQGVQSTAAQRMREKFLGSISEEQKKALTKEELDFQPHYVLLVQAADLEKA